MTTIIPQKSRKKPVSPQVKLSTATSSSKATTNGFEIIEAATPKQLMQLMNRKAVAVGLFANGHRHNNYLKAVGNVYFVDIDLKPGNGEAPYYQAIEAKLKAQNITFVSVPSKSADKHIFKRHIAIILDSSLPTGKKAFTEAANYILETVGIEQSKIDQRIAFNNIAFLAPASINKNFTGFDDLSSYYDGEALNIPQHLKAVYDGVTATSDNISSTQLIKFADGSTVTAYEAKKIIGAGESKSCYCPKHNDQHPSATFYHNANGRAKLFCAVCGDVKISTNFIPTQPSITHSNYNYSIILDNAPQARISRLTALIGECTTKTKTSRIWGYSIANLGNITQLLRAKVWLVDHGYIISTLPAPTSGNLLDTVTLHPITKNVALPTAYIPQQVQKSDYYYRYKQTATFVFKHYLFVEAAIYATYQNIIAPSRSFSDTCNLGLAYFDHILQTMDKQKCFAQSAKTYPMKLQGKAKTKSDQKRIKSKQRTDQSKMTARQKKLMQLIDSGLYAKPNGRPNLAAIAQKLKVKSRHTLYSDIEALGVKL